ncbi:hypothetical protein ACJYYY_01695 [Brochothrix campestris]|uniref:hypothetical protein n=1 Tax=Brochothrix campestris TaxID=2757 RepID=UPI0038D0525B
MKKITALLFLCTIVLLLTACGSSKKLTDYVEVNFSGIDSKGSASASIDEEKLIKDVFDLDSVSNIADEEVKNEIKNMDDYYKIELDKDKNLSNGDEIKVTITVYEEKTKKIKGGEKTIKVTGLDKPKKLTNKEVEKNLVINFTGASGRGTSKIDNVFDSPLDSVEFEIKNDGYLKNDDNATIILDKEVISELNDNGYVLEDNFAPKFKVQHLDNVLKNAKDIANMKDITRMINEEVNRSYEDSHVEDSWGTRYEVKKETLMYRQFDKDTDSESSSYTMFDSSTTNGNLIGVFSIKEYSGGTESKLEDSYTAIVGFSNIIADDKNKVNVADMEALSDEKDDTYSLESVLKLYEGYGYEKVQE